MVGISPTQACLQSWQGQEYVALPADLCSGYADTLLGKQGDYEYGSVICDRKEGSYLLLQRLIRYTTQRKAVWKIVQVKSLSVLNPNELALSQGCRQGKNPHPIVAIVQDNVQDHTAALIPQRAWMIDFSAETLIPVNPNTIQCHNIFQPSLGY